MKLVFSFLFLLTTYSVVHAQGNYTIRFESYYVQFDSVLQKWGGNYMLVIKDFQSFCYGTAFPMEDNISYPLGSSYVPKSTYFNVNKNLLLTETGYIDKPKTQRLVVWKYPRVKWILTKDTKIILGDTCIKATGILNDKEIVVYYSTKLPAGFGPASFVGLPGTVLEYSNPERRTQSTAVSIEFKSPEIVEPNFAKRISEKRFRSPF